MKSEYSTLILRIGLGIVFLYFATQQALNPDQWAIFVPELFSGSIITAENIVVMNSVLEFTLGIFLIIGLYTRLSGIILSIHLFIISISIGFNPTGFRDFGLACAALSLFFSEPDKYTFDSYYSKKQ